MVRDYLILSKLGSKRVLLDLVYMHLSAYKLLEVAKYLLCKLEGSSHKTEKGGKMQ